ncbi:tetratricopeptide repeat protein [Leeuwenhoekiella sp. MAR_2009_132]|uniref:tetratricopeptide repeat protein n=1 Tax=Leeuwenhoekiella sp. MAR_2009_132 TaxID=1392489 RepID=UPI00048B1638|nr:tetratricopeptide repeat protein [Leeuwenhoekiella sp. MAR_2009_132]
MMKKYVLLALITLVTLPVVTAQQSEAFTNELAKYNKALTLYNSKQYLAAQALFGEIKQETTDPTIEGDCAYYIANAAVRLNQSGADASMEKFVETYPTSTKRNAAYYDVAEYYFENGKYAASKRWYEQVDLDRLSYLELERFNFNMGYVHLKTNSPEEAKEYFRRVRNSEKYGPQAKYYEGFMAYENDDYEEASQLFEEVEAEEGVREDLSYFKADLNFKKGNFEEAIQLAKEQLPGATRLDASELNKIIGESYFNLGNFSEALPYLKEYKGKRGRWSNTDYYQLGYAYYKQGDFESAIGEFNKIVDGKNSVAQNAYYHLADAYLQTDRKQEALNAFRNAYQMDFVPKIKEDSGLNYAKLSYEIGNAYEPAPQAIGNYLEAYPNTTERQTLETLLIDSYITSKNYEGAMALIENNRNFQDKEAYQKVAFYRGIELYNDGNYSEAIANFEKSLKDPRTANFTARALYWKAESEYTLNNIDDALLTFKQFEQSNAASTLPEYKDLGYNLGYAYFKKKNYDQAIKYFESYSKSGASDNVRKVDAFMRLGDSYFISSKYWPAMEAYNAAIEMPGGDRDYATFQKAISYGFVDRNPQKIEALNSFTAQFPKSSYRDDALYELGNTYVATGNNDKGIEAYDRLVREIPKSKFAAKAQLKKALIYDNTGRSPQALALFKKVAQDFPGTPEGVQAVASAKLIYIDNGQVEEYGRWANGLDYISVEDSELDDAAFSSAEKQFVNSNNPVAIQNFEKYLREYPNGQRAMEAHFYLGQLYFGKEEFAKTIPHYKYVIDKERSEFTEQALARLGQVYLSERNYAAAVPVLQRLENESDIPQNTIFAQSNLMKSHYELKDYVQSVSYAEKVLANAKIDNKVKSDAQVIIARSAMKTNNESRAAEAYAQVLKIATGELAAEALYYDAFFKNKKADFKGSNVQVQKLAKDYSGYKEYGAKGLVLMAKNFYELGDAYQATYILDSVITNFTDYPEVVAEAKQELKRIKAAESKTNSSLGEN